MQNRIDQLTFVLATKQLERQAQWIRVTEVFKSDSDGPFLKKAGVADFDDPRFEKYTQRLKRLRGIRKYIYRMDILERELSYEEVTDIFVRVNSLGAKLRSSDLAMAQITAKWHEALTTFEEFQDECADSGFDVDLGIHVKNLVAFATGQSRFKTVGGLGVSQLQEAWEASKDGFQFAINFLKSNARIDSPTLLSSPFLMIALAYYGHKQKYSLSPKQEAELRYWLYVANTKGRFSRGSTETILDQDLIRIRDGRGVDGMIESLKSQFGRLDIQAGELEGRNARSAYFKTMFLAFREDGAKDWTSNLAISLSHSGRQHSLQFHHVFPKALVKGQFRPVVVNDIANLAFLGGRTNRKISKKEPEKYLQQIIAEQGPSALASQCIPNDDGLFKLEQFPAFLAERRRLIANRLNRFLEEARKPR